MQKNLAIVYEEQIEQKQILTKHCENAFSPVGISDYQTHSYEGFWQDLKIPAMTSVYSKQAVG